MNLDRQKSLHASIEGIKGNLSWTEKINPVISYVLQSVFIDQYTGLKKKR